MTSYPIISITIPCRNEAKYISKCLDSIVSCTYPKEFLKVFVCDGLSDDGTDEIIKEYQSKYPFIVYLKNEKRTTQFGLNLGVEKDSEVKIILGAHAEIYPDYIEHCLNAFKISETIGCVGGIIENVNEDENTKIISMALSSPFGVGNTYFRIGNFEGYVDTVAFGAYKKEVFERVGFFDEDLARNQDDEFNYRVNKGGFKIYLFPKIRSKYYVRADLTKLFKQYYQYGYWKVYVNKKHRAITTLRQLIPTLFVSFLTLGLLSCFLSKNLIGTYALILLVYTLCGLYFAAKKTKKITEILQVASTFFLLHISYGSGYLEGIFDFIVLGRKPKSKSTLLTR